MFRQCHPETESLEQPEQSPLSALWSRAFVWVNLALKTARTGMLTRYQFSRHRLGLQTIRGVDNIDAETPDYPVV